MFNKTWNHNTLRKYVVLFGTLFNNIYINRQDNNGETVQTLKVPLSYGPKDKYLAKAEGDPDFNAKVGIILPRMAFEMTGFNYAPDRKLNTVNKLYKQQADDRIFSAYQPVPYDIDFTLSIMVKNAEDGTKIVEQILPYFTPDWTATVELLPEVNGTYDIPIILNSVNLDDMYEGSFEQRRAIVWTLNFTMRGYVFGPVKKSVNLIKIANVDFRITTTPQIANTALANNVVVSTRPGLTANGQPTSNLASSIAYAEINPEDDYGFINSFIEEL